VNATPQLVMLTFDGVFSESQIEAVRTVLFSESLLNPNGCPIRTTWFAPFNGSDVGLLSTFLQRGHEIGGATVNYTSEPEPRDIAEGRRLLEQSFAGQEGLVRGFRTPDMKFTSSLFSYLKDLDFDYDSSIPEPTGTPFSPNPSQKLWPYTLDYGIATNCFIGHCNLNYQDTSSRYPGLWSIPVYTQDNTYNNTAYYGNTVATFGPSGSGSFINTLWGRNFLAHYQGNKAPFGIWLTPDWLTENPSRVLLLKSFLRHLLTFDDVWIVSGSDVIDYMRYPVDAATMAGNTTRFCPVALTNVSSTLPLPTVVEEMSVSWDDYLIVSGCSRVMWASFLWFALVLFYYFV